MELSLRPFGLRALSQPPAPPPAASAGATEGHLAQLFEANPNVMWISDVKTQRFVAVNEAAVARYGYTHDEFLAMRMADLLPIDERDTVASEFDELPGPRYLRNVPRIWRHVTRRGAIVLVEVARYPIVFRGRKSWLCLVTDVTERLSNEVKLRDEIDALKARLEAMQGDVAGARQLASAVAQTGADPRVQELARLLGAITVRETLDVSAIAEHEAHLLRLQDPARRVHVEIEPGLECMGDPALVRPLLRELFANAWKYTAMRTNPWMRLGRGVTSNGVHAFFLADNGAGFDESELVHGLGLAIASAAVRRHQGRLWAQAAPGQGATFLFTLAQAPTGT